ncbi:hypothetical protein VVE43_30580, partial [Pseudomonas aeruginosa]|uniref:hypothetical protein n=1 Tax=Pseudomonas aeruginosa TaxID=287 RepID=UPI00300C3C96
KAEIRRELANPGPERMLFVADALRAGFTPEEIHEICAIDPWFLAQIEDLVKEEKSVSDGILIVGFSTRPTVPNDFQIKIKKYLLTHLQPYLEALDHLALNVVKK